MYDKAVQRLQYIGHRIITTENSKTRPCAYCKWKKIRTKLGHRALSRHKCSKCDVVLCTKNRNCFALFHENLIGHEFPPSLTHM